MTDRLTDEQVAACIADPNWMGGQIVYALALEVQESRKTIAVLVDTLRLARPWVRSDVLSDHAIIDAVLAMFPQSTHPNAPTPVQLLAWGAAAYEQQQQTLERLAALREEAQ